jgi:mannosyltransferase OCH1-like enzyme
LGEGICEAHAAKRFASVSDILRVIVLSLEGGLYVDFDVLPMSLARVPVPFGAAFCLSFDSQKLRSVVPHAILMAPNHPFSEALLKQLEINLRLFKANPQPWVNNPLPQFQYAATVGVTGTIYSLMMRRITGLLDSFDKLMQMQMPYPFVHEEHNSWLENTTATSSVWRPIDYLEAQLDWVARVGAFVDIEEIANQYTNCTMGE